MCVCSFIGFGPFGNHNVNASWEAVQELEKLVTSDEFVLVTREIPVEYDTVKTLVPSLWKQFQPKVGKLPEHYFWSFRCMYILYPYISSRVNAICSCNSSSKVITLPSFTGKNV